MTPSKALFRSHLMQQFAAAARNQSRPPLALAAASSGRSRSDVSHLSSKFSSASAANRANSDGSFKVAMSRTARSNSSAAPATPFQRQDHEASNEEAHEEIALSPLASSFQTLITSRRTMSKFAPVENAQTKQSLKQTLDRAIVCAQAAPNHHKTEPFLFKRMMAPSNATAQLSEIAARVVLAKKLRSDPDHAQAHAARKRDKWNQVPAFLVTLVENNQQAPAPTPPPPERCEDDDDVMYEPIEYLPPNTERQLEDYASACAAVQNVLLSLHAEGIGTQVGDRTSGENTRISRLGRMQGHGSSCWINHGGDGRWRLHYY